MRFPGVWIPFGLVCVSRLNVRARAQTCVGHVAGHVATRGATWGWMGRLIGHRLETQWALLTTVFGHATSTARGSLTGRGALNGKHLWLTFRTHSNHPLIIDIPMFSLPFRKIFSFYFLRVFCFLWLSRAEQGTKSLTKPNLPSYSIFEVPVVVFWLIDLVIFVQLLNLFIFKFSVKLTQISRFKHLCYF